MQIHINQYFMQFYVQCHNVSYPTFHEYFAFPAIMRSGASSRLSAGQRMRPRDAE